MALLKRGRSDPGVGAETEVFPDCKATRGRKVAQKSGLGGPDMPEESIEEKWMNGDVIATGGQQCETLRSIPMAEF
jgi:hypothetical protein